MVPQVLPARKGTKHLLGTKMTMKSAQGWRDTRRYSFRNQIEVVDLGMRLEDVDGLETESAYSHATEWKTRANLRKNGATNDEIEFLLNERVELNAFASDEMIAWIEGKLDAHGVKKVVPDAEELKSAFLRMHEMATVQNRIDELLEDRDEDNAKAPDDLDKRVADRLEKDPALSWDAAMREIVEDAIDDAGADAE